MNLRARLACHAARPPGRAMLDALILGYSNWFTSASSDTAVHGCSVSYKRFGLTHSRHSNDKILSNLTRRKKSGRLQDGIDRYHPISEHGEFTIARCWRESSAGRRGSTRMVQSMGGTVVDSRYWRIFLAAPTDIWVSIDTFLQSIHLRASDVIVPTL
jgi:hypothetical protein